MSERTLNTRRKLGTIVYGILAGFTAAMVVTVASVFLVALTLWFLGKYGLGVGFGFGFGILLYAFLPGLMVGAVVSWKVCKSGWRRGAVP